MRSLPVAASSLPALIGLHAAAIVSPLADAFDAAADADANADADAPALTLSIRSPHVWVKAIEMGAKAQKARVSLSLARHPHLRPMPSQQRPDVKNSHRRCSYKDRRVTSNSTGLLRRRTWTEFKNSVYFHILADTCNL